MEVEEDGSLILKGNAASRLRPVVEASKKYKDHLCKVSFSSLSDYLWLLRASSQELSKLEKGRAMLYLAAAVSDFYIPREDLPQHKIQSSQGAPVVQLQLVPKMLKPLVSSWASNCFVASFKLETDPEILIRKSKTALETYGHDLVIGNILETRKKKVIFVTKESTEEIVMGDQELQAGMEIEEKIV